MELNNELYIYTSRQYNTYNTNYHSMQFVFLLIGLEPTTRPANNCLQMIVCSCVVPSKCFFFLKRLSQLWTKEEKDSKDLCIITQQCFQEITIKVSEWVNKGTTVLAYFPPAHETVKPTKEMKTYLLLQSMKNLSLLSKQETLIFRDNHFLYYGLLCNQISTNYISFNSG